jgi:hypothetical protein
MVDHSILMELCKIEILILIKKWIYKKIILFKLIKLLGIS